jgi:hypothetical protein
VLKFGRFITSIDRPGSFVLNGSRAAGKIGLIEELPNPGKGIVGITGGSDTGKRD